MSEIAKNKTDAVKLSLEDAKTLMSWADWSSYSLTWDLTIQQVLDLYHASNAYFTIDDWLNDDPKAQRVFDRIVEAKVAA